MKNQNRKYMLYASEDTKSGRKGSSVYQKNGVKRNFKMPVNPNSADQAKVRAAFGENSTTYGRLSAEQQLLWKTGAASYPRVNRVGNSYTMSGSAFYASVNQNLQNLKEQLGDENTEEKLLAPGAVLSPTYFTLKEQIGENEEDKLVVKSVEASEIMEADISFVMAYATSPKSSGTSFAGKSDYKLVHAFNKAAIVAAGTADAGLDLEAPYIAKFGSLPPAGSRVFVEFWGIEKTEGVLRLVGKQMLNIVPVTP